jgi:hypothetical protein
LLRFTGEEPRDLIQQFLSANPGMWFLMKEFFYKKHA